MAWEGRWPTFYTNTDGMWCTCWGHFVLRAGARGTRKSRYASRSGDIWVARIEQYSGRGGGTCALAWPRLAVRGHWSDHCTRSSAVFSLLSLLCCAPRHCGRGRTEAQVACCTPGGRHCGVPAMAASELLRGRHQVTAAGRCGRLAVWLVHLALLHPDNAHRRSDCLRARPRRRHASGVSLARGCFHGLRADSIHAQGFPQRLVTATDTCNCREGCVWCPASPCALGRRVLVKERAALSPDQLHTSWQVISWRNPARASSRRVSRESGVGQCPVSE
mmetsp:Transcript_11747/g.28633  ORF Transcript_11747/g.28633 Transcript_11747/m.28633 type:complete len:276 (-) Transcript_11747:180-1007(-)